MRLGRSIGVMMFPLMGVAAACALALGGCASSRAGKADAPGEKDYAALYSSGQYQKALEESSRVATGLRATDKPRAQLIAGLSAQALGRDAEAARWLTPLTDDADRGIAGKSAAALGLIRQAQGGHAEAAALLEKASKVLDGDDAARAAMYAGDSYKALGQREQARAMYDKARASVHEERGLQALIGDRIAALAALPGPTGSGPAGAARPTSDQKPSGREAATPASAAPRRWVDAAAIAPRSTRYCAQAGVYDSLSGAVNAAGRLRKFGKTRIAEFRDAFGRRLYGVRLGNYADPNQAEALCRKIGGASRVTLVEDR